MSLNDQKTWLPCFRRSMAYLQPHRRQLWTGLALALGVGAFYTFGISSVVPLLKILFSEHEPLVVWLQRVETERRLGVNVAADLPDSADGIRVEHVRSDARCHGIVRAGERIEAVGERGGSYAVFAALSRLPGETALAVRVVSAAGEARIVSELPLLAPRRGWQDLEDLVQRLIPSGADKRSRMSALLMVMAAVVSVTLLGGVCRFFNEGLIAAAVQNAMHDLRTHLGSHVLRLPMDWYSRHPPGDAISRFTTDIAKLETGLTTLFGKTIREPIKAMGVLALTIAIDWHLLVVAAIGFPFGVLAMRTFGRGIKKAQKRASQSWGRLVDHLGERIAGIRVVKAYGTEDAETGRFEKEDRLLTRAQTHTEYIDAATNPVLEVLAMIVVAGFIMYGGSLVFEKKIEANLFFAAVVCLAGTLDPIRKMGNVYNRVQAAEASAARLFELIDLEAERYGAAAAVSSPRWAGRVESAIDNPKSAIDPQTAFRNPQLPALAPFSRTICFDSVSFAYPANPAAVVLREIDLTVSKGQMIALVGANGSGKTTLVSLLLRFFEPTGGRVLIDDVDITGVTLASLRAQIGLVTQETVIFSDTARFNIAYGANGVAEADIQRAARMAHADDFISELRHADNGHVCTGYDAFINSRSLSGGQRQRIAIARAILRDPPILVLDEATSQVDADSERKIQEAMEEVTAGRTTFVIAHRFSTISKADRIVVLDEGRIVGVGRHDELIRDCPRYTALYQSQYFFSPDA